MTIKEQIMKLQTYKMYDGEDTVYVERDDVLKALEQQPNRCDSCTHSEEQDGSNCYECVKGMADNFEAQPTKMRDATEEERKSVKDYIESISNPTGVHFYETQPTEECEDNGSPWCLGHCPYRNISQCPYEDTIYREKVLKIIDNLSDLSYRWNIAKNLINNLPSATSQKKRGEGMWVETSEGTVCSECGKYPYDDGEYHIANWSSAFCPNCGAEMEVED